MEEEELSGSEWSEEIAGWPEEKVTSPEVRSTETDNEEYRYLLQRLKADFANYKCRVEQERQEQVKSANRDLILKLLPVMDDIKHALEIVPRKMANSEWVRGIALIERKLNKILEEEGLERIDAEGNNFNPWEHEAVFCEESSDDDDGRVKFVLRDGHKLHGKVIRPAEVVVCKGGEPSETLTAEK